MSDPIVTVKDDEPAVVEALCALVERKSKVHCTLTSLQAAAAFTSWFLSSTAPVLKLTYRLSVCDF